MKVMLYSLFAVFLMVGCEQDVKNGLYTEYYDNGQKSVEENYKDGKKDGLEVWWHENGKKAYEVNYKDGEEVEGSKKFWNSKRRYLIS